MPMTVETARAKLGPAYADAIRLLARGVSVRRVAVLLDVDARVLSIARPRAEGAPGTRAEAETLQGDEPRVRPTTGRKLRRYAGRLNKDLRTDERARILIKLARSNAPVVALKALERIDDLTGHVAQPVDVDPNPPPLFALPMDVELDFRAPASRKS